MKIELINITFQNSHFATSLKKYLIMCKKQKNLRTIGWKGPDFELTGKSEMSVMDLPAEIILDIFSYLDRPCLLQSVSLVCKTWNRLAFDSSLWKKVSLNTLEEKGILEKALNKFICVQNLTIKNECIGLPLVEQLSRLPRLQLLSLSWQHCICRSCKSSREFTPLLTYGDIIEGNKFKNHKLCKLQHLKCLKFNGFGLRDDNFHTLLINCSGVREISLVTSSIIASCNNVYNKILMNLNNSIFLNHCDSLEIYNADCCLNDNCFVNLNMCRKLTKLQFNNCFNLTDQTLFKIMSLSNLTELNLHRGTNFTSDGLKNMFDKENLSNLTVLKLIFFSNLNDLHLNIIASNCTEIQILDFNCCPNISDTGMSYIIKNCSSVLKISLTGVRMIKGLFMLDIKDNKLINLKVLKLDCRICKNKYTLSVKAARPTLKIVESEISIFSGVTDGLSCSNPLIFIYD